MIKVENGKEYLKDKNGDVYYIHTRWNIAGDMCFYSFFNVETKQWAGFWKNWRLERQMWKIHRKKRRNEDRARSNKRALAAASLAPNF